MAAPGRKPDANKQLLNVDDLLTVLDELDDSDIGDFDQDDEPSHLTLRDGSLSGNWTDDTDEDPDFDPNNQEETSSDDSDPGTSTQKPKRRKIQPAVNGTSTSQASSKKATKRGTKQMAPSDPVWKTALFHPSLSSLSQPSYLPIDTSDWPPDKYVEQYLDDDILSTIVDKTNQTYVLKSGKSMGITLNELKVWIGINCIMSAIQLPKIRMYWEKKWRIPLVADAMTRDRYFIIRTSIKVVFDSDISGEMKKTDRLWKLRPLINRVLDGCMRQPRMEQICIDEMMIPFSGACGLKQFVPNKPNPVGLKVFVLANPNGIICDFKVYEGASTFPQERSQGFALCESAILNLTQSLVPGHVLYFDRYFTTVRLAEELLKKGIHCSGTIMKNRIPNNTDFISDKEFKKSGRGSIAVTVREDEKIAITKWLDNSAVAILSTHEADEPVLEVKRWSKLDKKYITVKQPKVIHSYNQNMGGVDLADRMMSYCPSRARTKKWTVRCIMHFIDLSLTNSWLQMREDMKHKKVPEKNIPQFRMFKLSYGQNLIEKYDQLQQVNDSSSDEDDETFADGRKTAPPSLERRTQGAKHLPDVSTGVQKRCRQKGCSKKTSVFCITCKAYLCLLGNRNCFLKFHTK